MNIIHQLNSFWPSSQVIYLWIDWSRRLILATDLAEPTNSEMPFQTSKERLIA